MPQMVVRNLLLVFLYAPYPLRPGTNQTHVPHQHVPELGKLIEPRRPQKLS